MQCKKIIFSGHAIRRMFERGLKKDDVLQIIERGERIVEYSDDKPFPSCLLLGFIGNDPLHVVVAFDQSSETCHVITAYPPDPLLWYDDFKGRRTL